jgi:predicted aconitase with swiveling domain
MSSKDKARWKTRVLVPGEGQGEALVLAEPLSLWGGLDPQSGQIIDGRHPSRGQNVTGKVMILPGGRGSSSASSILLESVRVGTAPAAIITAELDGILALGAIVALELYEKAPPVVFLTSGDYAEVCRLVQGGNDLELRVSAGLVKLL